MSNATTIVEVPFHGDTIQAIQQGDRILVSLRRCCDALGVDITGQLTKLKTKPWACIEMISMHDSSGRGQDMACINLESLPMWLATIELGRVAGDARDKLARYQCEAAKVLAAYFFGPQVSAVVPGVQPTAELASRLDRIEAMLLATCATQRPLGRVHSVQATIRRLLPYGGKKSKMHTRAWKRCTAEFFAQGYMPVVMGQADNSELCIDDAHLDIVFRICAEIVGDQNRPLLNGETKPAGS